MPVDRAGAGYCREVAMRTQCARVARLATVAVAWCLLGAAGPNAAGQVAIAEYAGIGHALFGVQDLDALDKAVKLTPAEREAAESLMRGAMARARSIQGKFYRRCGEESEAMQELVEKNGADYAEAYKNYTSSYAKNLLQINREIAAVERDALGDLMAALDREQIEKGWPAFERYRRRIILDQYGYGAGMGTNPHALVGPLKLDAADTEAIVPILAHYEDEVDPLLILRMKGLERVSKEVAENGDYDPTVWARPELARARIHRLNIRTSEAIERALSEEGRRLFLRQRVGAELQWYLNPPSIDESVKRMFLLTFLTPEQKERMRALATRADAAAFEVAFGEMRANDKAAMRDEESDPKTDAEELAKKVAELQRKGAAAASTLLKGLRAILTPAQQDELYGGGFRGAGIDPFKEDRMPPIDSPWIVKPEPAPGGAKERR